MKYVMVYETAPNGLEKARENYPAHRARLDEFHAQGTLIMAGPLIPPDHGALGIFTTREAAQAFIDGDPFVLNGVVGQWRIEEWNEVLA
jgi:uncharacterized protein YciI